MRVLLSFVGLIALMSSVAAPLYGQWSTGTGFFINQQGLVITNRHVLAPGCDAIIVETMAGERSTGHLIKSDPDIDVAAISTNFENNHLAFLRAGEDYRDAEPPANGEHVHTLGFPDGKLSPRGGLVSQMRDPTHGSDGFTIGMSTSFGASGSPVFDDNGLLVGVVWGGRDYEERGRQHINVFAITNQALFDFLQKLEVRYGVSTIEDAPLKKNENDDFFTRADKILSMAYQVVVRIYCKAP
jgi:S1-C subfamily serine protease